MRGPPWIFQTEKKLWIPPLQGLVSWKVVSSLEIELGSMYGGQTYNYGGEAILANKTHEYVQKIEKNCTHAKPKPGTRFGVWGPCKKL
jgi:hypothetical protein